MTEKNEEVKTVENEEKQAEVPPRYEPPKLEKFERLEKIILSGE